MTRLYTDADGKLVDESDPSAAFYISDEDAAAQGLIKAKPAKSDEPTMVAEVVEDAPKPKPKSKAKG